MNRNSGHTILELTVAVFVFTIVVLLVFSIFISGHRLYHQATLRQGLQGDARRFISLLQHDMSLTDFNTVSTVSRIITLHSTPYHRDALAVGSLSDWNNPSNFTPLNLPRWDSYIVYYATTGENGLLIRQEIRPTPVPMPDGFKTPYSVLSSNISDTPTANADVFKTSILSRSVLDFKVEPQAPDQAVKITLKLRRRGGKRAGTYKQVDETFEVRVLSKAENTWPRL